MCRISCLLHLLVAAIILTSAQAQAVTVWLDFGSAWETELDAAATGAGVSTFSSGERDTIEANILSSLEAAYTNFDVTFVASATDPGGTRERINFGATTASSGTLGSAPLDWRNLFTGTQSMFVENFDFIIESGDARATQITELSTALAGTAAHELGHSLGMRHHAAYGTNGILPSNYSSTGGLQNAHIMATGSTGLGESGRETVRSFSRWSNLTMEAANGAGLTLVASPVPVTFEGGDAGDTFGTAQALTLTSMPISGLDAALVQSASLDGSGTDVDYYSFSGTAGQQVTAELWSIDRYVDDFDGILTLYGPDGTTVLGTNDDVFYSSNTYDGVTFREDDAFLLNVPLTSTGTHYIAVSVASDGAVGDDYDLLIGVAVPEPATWTMAASGLLIVLGGWFIRRRQSSSVS